MIRIKNSIFLVATIFVSQQIFSQKVMVHAYMEDKQAPPQGDTIYYNFGHPLAWADFQGKPVDHYFAGAVTASGFAFDSHVTYDGHAIFLDIGIYTFFTRHDSWKKPQINSAYHLLHEQHHFDITRIGAENFLDAIHKAKFTGSNYQHLLSSLFNKAYDQNVALQQRYDKQTNHSLDVSAQLQWNKTISAAIEQIKRGVFSGEPF